MAIAEGRAFADTEFGNNRRSMDNENVPSAVFSQPEAATVGMTEAQAREKLGEAVKCYRARFRPLFHNLTGQDEKTIIKLVVDGNTDKVLGAHMVGEYAAEIIQGVAIAVKMGATKKTSMPQLVFILPPQKSLSPCVNTQLFAYGEMDITGADRGGGRPAR